VIHIQLGAIRYLAIVLGIAVTGAAVHAHPQLVRQAPSALIDTGLYDEAERSARAAFDRLRSATGGESLQVATAADGLVRALILNGRGPSKDTLALARQTVRTKEAHLGLQHADLIPSLLNLGDALIAAVEFAQGIAVTQRALALSERHSGPFRIDVARALDHVGNALAAAARYDDSVKALERSLRLKEATLDGSDVAIARTLEDLGLVLQRKGEYNRAGALLRRAAGIQEATGINHPAYTRTLNLLAQQLWFEGDLVASKKASERALDSAARTLRPDHPIVALSMRYLAGTLADLGDLSGSLALKQRALAIAERNFGANHFTTVDYVYTLGLAEVDQGAYATARRHFEQALRIYETRFGPWHEYVATSLSVLALADASLGDYVNAQRAQARAVAIHARVGGPNHPFVATALTGLAMVYREQGLLNRAVRALERALTIREKSLGPDHRDVARTLVDLASTVMQAGRPRLAQELASRALRIWEDLDAPDAPDFATVLALYAEIQGNRGDHVAARLHYERALRIRAKVFGVSHPLHAETTSGLAFALAGVGETSEAIAHALDAEETGRQHLRTTLRYLAERQSLAYAATRPRGLDLAISLAATDPDTTSRVFDALVRTRALVLDELAARRHVRTDATATTIAPVWAALTSARQRLANLVVRGPGDQPLAQYAKLVDDARGEKELAERAVGDKSVTFRNERTREDIGLEDVRAALPAHSALVAFAKYDHTIIEVETAGSSTATRTNSMRVRRTVPSYSAFVVRAGQPGIATVPLGSASSLDVLIARWRDEATGVLRASTVSKPERTYRIAGAALRRRAWDPIAAHVKGAAMVFIVPDGTLSLVSLAALPVGQTEYLIDNGPIIHYLSAERDLITSRSAPPPNRGLLAIGGAAFDDPTVFTGALTRAQPVVRASRSTQSAALRASCGDLASLHFTALPGTGHEVHDLARLWTESPVGLLEHRGANERAFKQTAPGHRVLHLATHGFFLGSSCSRGTGGTRAVGGLSAGRNSQPRIGMADNPLLLSGLALAGANRRAEAGPDDEDGILMAEEVAGLNLHGVEWAVLSACDTGLGEVKVGEGVFGLRRAFQVAGVRTVIMGLWSVGDESARAWMTALYEGRLKRRLTTADAVHQASLAVLRTRRAARQSTHPFHWAAFVAAGDWR
jgi:CHAT domain-containing protein/tetratricopeptide (TPR) repeat protein